MGSSVEANNFKKLARDRDMGFLPAIKHSTPFERRNLGQKKKMGLDLIQLTKDIGIRPNPPQYDPVLTEAQVCQILENSTLAVTVKYNGN